MKVRDHIAVSLGCAAGRINRFLSGRTSTALPGYIAERIGSNPLKTLIAKRRYKAIICITGTNGKTTTTLLTKTALEQAGYVVVNNSSGSNLYRGILTTLMHDTRQGFDTILLLEVDEASLPRVMRAIHPTHCVVLNLFRDQLDRYGEVDTTRRLLDEAFRGLTDIELLLNADDPHVANLGLHHQAQYFGLDIKSLAALPHDHAADVPVSPATGSIIEYRQRYFGHVGDWRAADNSIRRPPRDVSVTRGKIQKNQQHITLKLRKKQHTFVTQLTGVYSLYNVAATSLILDRLGISWEHLDVALKRNIAAFGRQEVLPYQGAYLQFFLIKNPTGFNQVIQSHLQSGDDCPIVFIINDNFADGRDVSWLWDAALEDVRMRGPMIVSGLRAYDMALRLEYAGLTCVVEMDVEKALQRAAELAQGNIAYILPTYTALLHCRKIMALELEHRQ